jgi:tetrahydromethanopterin S-methyltransferase subunit C
MALGILAIPGVGPLIAAGPMIAALAGAGVGAVAGGLTGSIIGMRMPAFEAIQYQGEMGGGNVLISVLTSDATERDRVKAIFDNAGSVHGRGSGCGSLPTAGRLGPWELR